MLCYAFLVTTSLTINTASVSAIGIELSLIPYVGLCVCLCPESVLRQNDGMDPDADWGGEWGRSRDGSGDRRRDGAILGVTLGRPIVTNGDFVA